jgi:hypothetical protein
MKNWVIGILLIFVIFFGYFQLTGNVSDGLGFVGPSSEQMACMQECSGCTNPSECSQENINECYVECGITGKPEPVDEGEACMQECILIGCGEFDFDCQGENKEKCEEECGMIKEPDESEMSAEQICITNCVEKEDPDAICGNSKEGETGNALCQKCASECVHLYEGPCLNDEQLTKKEKECEVCEHCYGEPVEGPSGQGWNCIVDVTCEDASDEFGDEPGEGPGIGQEGYVAPNFVAEQVDSLIKFVKGLFSSEEKEEIAENTEEKISLEKNTEEENSLKE